MRPSLKGLVLALALAVPAVASASGEALRFDDIRAQQAEIRAGVVAGKGRYQGMPQSTRTELLNRQGQVLALIEGKQVPADLSQDQRTEVFNHLEWIEAAANGEDDERLICEHRPTLGSNRKTRVCRTAAQMREERERAREDLERTHVQMRR
jgi:hypothetical protein